MLPESYVLGRPLRCQILSIIQFIVCRLEGFVNALVLDLGGVGLPLRGYFVF